MGTKPKSPQRKPGEFAPGSKAQAQKKPKKQRPNSILLADLFLWISVVDECLYHPVGAFERAAKTEGYGSVGNVTQRLDVLENEFGMLLYRNLSSGYRSGVPTFRGAALADLFAVIELLHSRALSLEISGFLDELLRKLKGPILDLAARRARRVGDDLGQNRIKTSLVWRTRQMKTGRSHDRKKMADWPTLGPSPVKPRTRLLPTSARSRG
jgi:hypothetical protein